MYEDIGALIGKWFDTWKRNLNLAIPFVLNVVVIGLLISVAFLAVLLPIAPTLSDLASSPQDIENVDEIAAVIGSAIEGSLGQLAAVLIIFVLVAALVNAFFTAGAIGMAREATARRTTTLKAMWAAGKDNYLSLFFAHILTGIIAVVGFVILSLPFLSVVMEGIQGGAPQMGSMIIWIVLLVIYGLLISLALALVPYALVVDGLGPVAAIKAGVRFFRSNVMDVFLVWLIVLAISMALGVGGTVFSGYELAAAIWSVLQAVISIAVLAPLSAVWWVRLYMSRTGKDLMEEKLYEDEEVKYL